MSVLRSVRQSSLRPAASRPRQERALRLPAQSVTPGTILPGWSGAFTGTLAPTPAFGALSAPQARAQVRDAYHRVARAGAEVRVEDARELARLWSCGVGLLTPEVRRWRPTGAPLALLYRTPSGVSLRPVRRRHAGSIVLLADEMIDALATQPQTIAALLVAALGACETQMQRTRAQARALYCVAHRDQVAIFADCASVAQLMSLYNEHDAHASRLILLD